MLYIKLRGRQGCIPFADAFGDVAFVDHIKRIEEAAVDSIYTDLRLRGTDDWTEVLVKEKACNFVTTLLTLFTFDRA